MIINCPECSYFYAKDVIKDRWLEAELIIRKEAYWWKKYSTHFEMEDKL